MLMPGVVWSKVMVVAQRAIKLTSPKHLLLLALIGVVGFALITAFEYQSKLAAIKDTVVKTASIAGGEADYDLAQAALAWNGYRFIKQVSQSPGILTILPANRNCGMKLSIISKERDSERVFALNSLAMPVELLDKEEDFNYLVSSEYVIIPRLASNLASDKILQDYIVKFAAKSTVKYPEGLVGAGPPVPLSMALKNRTLYLSP